jgi:short-subunit dehydrogenase
VAALTPGLAVVTGGTAGIGREFCEQLAARGHDLLIVARDASRMDSIGQDLERRHRIRVEALPADLSVEPEILRVAERLRNGAAPAILVNNAGFGTRGTLVEADVGPQAAMLRLHTLAPMHLTMAVLPGMVRRGSGAVVNVSSVASFVYSPGNANYCATKAYLTTFSEGAAAEVRPSGVLVQALCPGFTHTEFHDRMQAMPGRLPAFAWLTATQVVRESLEALDRRGPPVCIPGLRYKAAVGLLRLTPRRMIGWVSGLRRMMM